MSRIRLKTREYEICWKWRESEDNLAPVYFDTVEAKTAPEAISMVKDILTEQYSFKSNDLIIMSAIPTMLDDNRFLDIRCETF